VDPGTPVRPAWLDIWHNAPGIQNVPGSLKRRRLPARSGCSTIAELLLRTFRDRET